MEYLFLENKNRSDLKAMQQDELVEAYLHLQDIYNKTEEELALNLVDTI
jgi:hypothetical protein